MHDSTNTQKQFPTLSLFAEFILRDHLEEYVRAGLRQLFDANLPIMKFFKDLGEQQLFDLSMQGSRALLKGLADGRPGDMLKASIEMWTSNQLPWMEKDDVVTEDITLLSHVRKKTLLQFIPRFTTDPARIITLVNELDEWQLDYSTQTFKTFVALLQERINQQLDQKVQAEEVLLGMTAELQRSNASLREFAFVASHDLKEPLRKISTLGERLLETERENFTQAGKVYLDKIINSALRMQQLVDDLLSLSQITSDAQVEKVQLSQLLAHVLQTFETRLEILRAVIQADPLPEAIVVPSQFRRLFQNLIANSLKFARKDLPPVLKITWTHIDGKAISDSALRKAPVYLKLTFTDNGIGFDNQFADKIFEIFQRLHSRSEYDGTGIGLAICRKIVENHGGTIQATGTLEKGSTFTIIIPQTSMSQGEH